MEPASGSRIERWARHPAGPALLFGFAVLEGTLFPAPTEALFLALALGRPRRVGWLLAIAVTGSVGGGALGYFLAAVFFESVGQPVLEWSGGLAQLDAVGRLYRDHLFITLATSGYTPIPYLVYTMAAGVFRIPLLPFLGYSLVGRGVKYLVLGAVALGLGRSIRTLLSRRTSRSAAVVLVVLLLIGLWVFRL